ncbi:MAG: TlyA family RNA methyltransferase [Clostridia bacterium]|nr:TlyA family RNA methyltransferase [Clostridia bacterium]
MKTRLDCYLVENGLAGSRERARALIMAGKVRVNGRLADKAGFPVPEGASVSVVGGALPYVSRGGFKLEKALRTFPIDLKGRVAADIGASTGGFTDCMLQNGARRVYAVDVGYGQLDWRLRSDERVVTLERRNARFMEPAWFEDGPFSFASIDVSFISLRLILPPLHACLPEGGEAVALIKPQFEAGRAEVGKRGVVRDPAVHRRVCEESVRFAVETGFSALGLCPSPIKGPEGNIEFLLWIMKETPPRPANLNIGAAIDEAHN